MNAFLNNIQNEYVSSVSNKFEMICVIQKKYFEVFSDKKQNKSKTYLKKQQPLNRSKTNNKTKTGKLCEI